MSFALFMSKVLGCSWTKSYNNCKSTFGFKNDCVILGCNLQHGYLFSLFDLYLFKVNCYTFTILYNLGYFGDEIVKTYKENKTLYMPTVTFYTPTVHIKRWITSFYQPFIEKKETKRTSISQHFSPSMCPFPHISLNYDAVFYIIDVL